MCKEKHTYIWKERLRPLKKLPALSCWSQRNVQEAAAGKLRGDVASPTSSSNAPVENTCLDKSGVWLWCAGWSWVSLPDRSGPPYMYCSGGSKRCWKPFYCYVGFTMDHCRCAYQSAVPISQLSDLTWAKVLLRC